MAGKKKETPEQEAKRLAEESARAARESQEHMDAARMQRAIASALGAHKNYVPAQFHVGIRNISGSTVGIPAWSGEPSFSLNPFSPSDPDSVAIIPWPRWQQLRKSKLFDFGMIERYDEILDESYAKSPADRPQDCAPNHAKNRVPDGHEFITTRTEDELRRDIMAMTSEESLHRLQGTVDEKVRELQKRYREEGDPNAPQRAVDTLPMNYQLAERLLEQRLMELQPRRVEELKPFQRIR